MNDWAVDLLRALSGARPHPRLMWGRFRLRNYLLESLRQRDEYPGALSVADLFRFFLPWHDSLDAGRSPLTDARPWVTFPAIRFLDRVLTRPMRVFEYGTGGSTLYFARRVTEVISIEHDAAWARRVETALGRSGLAGWQYRFVAPVPDQRSAGADPAEPQSYATADAAYRAFSFRNYASAIDDYPDASFDLVLIDGRARPSCAMHALPKIKPRGLLVWDNTDREYYWPMMQQVREAHFRQLDLPGPVPYLRYFGRTTVWQHEPAG